MHAAYDAVAYNFAPSKSYGGYPFIMDGVIVMLPTQGRSGHRLCITNKRHPSGRKLLRIMNLTNLRHPLAVIAVAAGPGMLFAASPAAAQTSAAPAAHMEAGSLWNRDTFLGDMGGLRPTLAKYGITFALSETSEVLGNVTGGVHQGAEYDGLTELDLSIDSGKAFGWSGGKLYVSALQIHGRNLSADNLYNLQTASGIEADRATRLWELWYRQRFFNGKADLKFGQQTLDKEFIVSQYAGLFLNTMMGWPMVPSVDLYAGGPAYPLSSLGVRLRAHPTPSLTLLAGVFDDNPPGGPFNDDSALRGAEASGTAFNLNTGALWIGEVQYAVNRSPAKACRFVTCGLPGTWKLGAWFDTAGFPDQRFGTDGRSLADPLGNGIARTRRGNFSIYAVVDQTLWRAGPGSSRSLNVFLRPMGAPGDRNLIPFSLNAGVTLKAPFAGRANDAVGIGYDFARVGGGASALDRDRAFFSGMPYPVRSNESVLELTYQAQLTRWWVLQPDFQYVFNPGGGIPNPRDPARRIGDEAIFGIRTVITF